MNKQKLQMFMLCLRSIYASMTFNCPLMLNNVGSEKIPLPQAHMLFRFAVYRDSYLDTNPKIAIRFSEAIPTPKQCTCNHRLLTSMKVQIGIYL